MLPSTGAVMQLLREDQTTRRGVQIACGVIALATLALAACNNENQTGPGGANTLVFVGNVNGANASLAGSLVLTVDETRVAATFKVIAPGSEAGTGTGEDGTATIGDEGVATIGDKGKATGDGGTGTGDAGTGSNEAGTDTDERGTATNETGTASGQTRTVTSNTANTLTVSPAWTTIPDGTSKYAILNTSTTLQDISKSWHTNIWTGRPVTITAGTGMGQTSTVSSNTKNTLTVSPAWTTIPDGTSKYAIRQTSTTLQHITKEWPINLWVGRFVTINAGTGAGQASTVTASDSTRLTVSPAWTTTPDGTSQYVITASSTALADSTKTWTANQWAGRPVVINAGTGAGQTRTVLSNTTDTLTVSPAWDPIPDATSEYVITQTATTLQDITKTWTVDQWAGRPVRIAAGAGAGQTGTGSTNTANTLTVSPAWTTMPDATSEYRITQASTKLQDITKTWTTDQWKTRVVTIKAGTGAGQSKTVSSNTANTLTVSSKWSTNPDDASTDEIVMQTTTTIELQGTYSGASGKGAARGAGH